MKKALAMLVVAGSIGLAATPPAHAGSSTDAALALGAFAVFNQFLTGQTVFQQAPQPVYVAPPPVYYAPPPPPPVYYAPPPPPIVYTPPPPPPVVYYTPPPVAYYPSYVYPAPRPYYPRHWRRHREWDD